VSVYWSYLNNLFSVLNFEYVHDNTRKIKKILNRFEAFLLIFIFYAIL